MASYQKFITDKILATGKSKSLAPLAIDECSNQGACPVSAVCINTQGSFICQCNNGFEGHLCTDVDECSTNAAGCDMNADCINTDLGVATVFLSKALDLINRFHYKHPMSEGSFKCDCRIGYYGNGVICASGQSRIFKSNQNFYSSRL